MEPPQDRILVERTREGDMESFGILVRRYQAAMRSLVAFRVPWPEEVLDIVQESFLEALRNLDRYDPDRPLLPWLRGICRNRMRMFYRNRQRNPATPMALVENALADTVEDTDEDAEAVLTARVRALRHCLEKLSPQHRELVGKRYYEYMDINSLADGLNRSRTSVTQMLYRIRQSLQRCIATRGEPA